ncbi:hypothetical protein [Promicromonospora panici]|uniref:hypothetical protein n=1 Tax=Promicromonospora panici TaxID=2219658 RepID=UPI00101B7C4C|nr:hypothetical protein [Promicromonospora panici]
MQTPTRNTVTRFTVRALAAAVTVAASAALALRVIAPRAADATPPVPPASVPRGRPNCPPPSALGWPTAAGWPDGKVRPQRLGRPGERVRPAQPGTEPRDDTGTADGTDTSQQTARIDVAVTLSAVGQGEGGGTDSGARGPGSLPRTGADLLVLAQLAAGAVAAGMRLRRRARRD